MKKTRLLWLAAVLLLSAMILSSCGSVSSVTKILNKDYDPSADVFTKEAIISELAGYSVADANGEFVLLENQTDTALSRKIFSFRAEKVILTLASTTYEYGIDFVEVDSVLPMFIVSQKEIESEEAVAPLADTENTETPGATSAPADDDVTYTLYDAQGNVVKTTDYEADKPSYFVKDLVIYDGAAYAISDDGVLTKEVDVPEYIELDGYCYDYNDDYYYFYDNEGILVYDHSFNLVSSWYAPYYDAEGVDPGFFVLNNGDILVQYMYELDEDSKKYDISYAEDGYTAKLDLVSLVVSAEDGKAKEVELDYLVYYVLPNYELYDEEEDDNRYTDSFENIALLRPIVNKKVNESEAAVQVVLLTNKGKVDKVIEFVDNQGASLPRKLAEDRYILSTLAGYVILNDKGDVIKSFNNALEQCGSYFIGEKAIYDLDLNVVYNLVENDAKVMENGFVGDTVFVEVETDTSYSVIAFCNGEQKTILTKTEGSESTVSFELFGGIGYVLTDSASGDHKYYNAEGTLIVTTSYELSMVGRSYEGDVMLLMGVNGESNTFHVFSVAD